MTTSGELTADSTVVVVGASLAGWRAVETLRTEGFEGSITLVGEERHLPYDRPPLSKQVLAGTWPPEKAVLADKRRSSEHRVHEVLGRRAVRLDVDGRRVELDDGEVLHGDAIVVTTGAAPRKLLGTESLSQRDGLFTLRTLDDSLALRAAVTAIEAPRVVVIGAGFIGAEVASTCAGLGCRVTVLEAIDVPLRNVLGPMLGAYCGSLHGAHGVELRTGVAVLGVTKASAHDDAGVIGGGGRLVVELGGGEMMPADVVVVGIGVVPSTDWLAGSGLTVENGVVCDDRLFAADGIVAAGDIARWNWRSRRRGRVDPDRALAGCRRGGRRCGAQRAGGPRRRAVVHAPSHTSGPISTASDSRFSEARAETTTWRSSTDRSATGNSSRCSVEPVACVP